MESFCKQIENENEFWKLKKVDSFLYRSIRSNRIQGAIGHKM